MNFQFNHESLRAGKREELLSFCRKSVGLGHFSKHLEQVNVEVWHAGPLQVLHEVQVEKHVLFTSTLGSKTKCQIRIIGFYFVLVITF